MGKKFFPYGGDELFDNAALLMSGKGRRCDGCDRVTINKYLKDGRCPICREDSDRE